MYAEESLLLIESINAVVDNIVILRMMLFIDRAYLISP